MIGATPEMFMPVINSEKSRNSMMQFIAEPHTKILIVSKVVSEMKEDYLVTTEINDFVLRMQSIAFIKRSTSITFKTDLDTTKVSEKSNTDE